MHMKKLAKKLSIFGVCIIFFAIGNKIIENMLDIEKIALQMNISLELLKAVKSGILLALSLLVSTMVDHFDFFVGLKEEKSEVSLFINDVSEIRKSRRMDTIQEIIIGNKSKYFVYVSGFLKNIGNNEIIRLLINGDHIKVNSIPKSGSVNFRLKIYCDAKRKIKRCYRLRIEFEDEKNVCYKKKAKMKIDLNKKKAVIKV